MSKAIDITGQRFGRLTAIEPTKSQGWGTSWLCICDCGKTKAIRSDVLRHGESRSCGCLSDEARRRPKPKTSSGPSRKSPEGARQFEREQYEKHKDKRKARELVRHESAPYKRSAKTAILLLIKRKRLLPAKNYRCVECGNQALDFHHQSYRVEDRLNVVPICRSCHVKVHTRGRLTAHMGIVVLPMGIIRIAIVTGA